MLKQKHLIHDLDREDGSSWLIMLDAGRADYFQELYDEYLDGEYQTVHNGGNRATPYWFKDVFSYPVDGFLFHGGQKIKNIMDTDYDEDECFEHVPSPMLYDTWGGGDIPFKTPDPASVNEVVEQHLPEGDTVEQRLVNLGYKPRNATFADEAVSMNVVRYLQPHAPYRSLPDISDQRDGIQERVEDGRLSRSEWQEAYTDNYRWGLEYAAELIETLREWGADNIVVTSDHGECFGDCGAWFHGTSTHDHLVEVPWLRVQ